MKCECGARTRQWTDDIFMCPNCIRIYYGVGQTLYSIEREKVPFIIASVNDYITNMIKKATRDAPTAKLIIKEKPEKTKKPEAKKTKKKTAKTKDTVPCECCGTTMSKKCGSICPNCKWMKPCSLE